MTRMPSIRSGRHALEGPSSTPHFVPRDGRQRGFIIPSALAYPLLKNGVAGVSRIQAARDVPELRPIGVVRSQQRHRRSRYPKLLVRHDRIPVQLRVLGQAVGCAGRSLCEPSTSVPGGPYPALETRTGTHRPKLNPNRGPNEQARPTLNPMSGPAHKPTANNEPHLDPGNPRRSLGSRAHNVGAQQGTRRTHTGPGETPDSRLRGRHAKRRGRSTRTPNPYTKAHANARAKRPRKLGRCPRARFFLFSLGARGSGPWAR